jgi:hypothetical protein
LFELLCTARTRSGEETLAAWLCAPAGRAEILRRQQALEELRNNIDLREDLAVLGPDLRASVQPELMAKWGNLPPVLESAGARVIAPVLAAFLIWSVLYTFVWNGNVGVVLVALALAGGFALFYRNRVRRVIADVDEPARELEILGLVLSRLERERFTSPKLKALRAELEMTGKPPSRQIKRLKRLLELLNSRLNMMFAGADRPWKAGSIRSVNSRRSAPWPVMRMNIPWIHSRRLPMSRRSSKARNCGILYCLRIGAFPIRFGSADRCGYSW